MKKCYLFLLVVFSITIISHAYSDTFQCEVFVEADQTGVITIRGGEGITALIQFCPDEWVDGCPKNVKIERKGNTFTLNEAGLSVHQNAFGFINATDDWLLIPDRMNVTVGKNVNIVKGSGGSCFIYTWNQK